MSKIILRPATRNDAADLAILDNIAGHGISQWFWQGAVKQGKASDAYDWGRARMMADDAFYGWSNATIATCDDITVGTCTSYKMPPPDDEDDAGKSQWFTTVFELFAVATGDWFIDSLAVYSHARGRGAARALMEDALQRGRDRNEARVSLVCEDSNTSARALYESLGFSLRDKRPYIPFNDNSTTKEWLLLSMPLIQEAI